MEEERLRRYKAKIERIEKRLEEIKVWKKSFLEKEKDRLAVYKAFQEIVEASMDLIAMMLKDVGNLPEDNYTNIDKVCGKYLSENIKPDLTELNGLRNRIVHEYNGLDGKLALKSIDNLTPKIAEFLKEVKEWLKRRS